MSRLGQHKSNFNVIPYQKQLQELFQHEAEILRNALGNQVVQIEHIGSTAIPGLAAKPIIDIMVAVDSLTKTTELIPLWNYSVTNTAPQILFRNECFLPKNQPQNTERTT